MKTNPTNKQPDFQKSESYEPRNEKERLLMKVIASLKSEENTAALLRDLLTLPELEEFANRITIAKRLLKGDSYLSISRDFGVSTTTVTRVAHWLYNGCGGYMRALKKTNP